METNVIEVESKPLEEGKYVRRSIQVRHHSIVKYGPYQAVIDRIVVDIKDFDISKPDEIRKLYDFITTEQEKGKLLVIATNLETSNEPFPDNFDDPIELSKEGEKIRDIPLIHLLFPEKKQDG